MKCWDSSVNVLTRWFRWHTSLHLVFVQYWIAHVDASFAFSFEFVSGRNWRHNWEQWRLKWERSRSIWSCKLWLWSKIFPSKVTSSESRLLTKSWLFFVAWDFWTKSRSSHSSLASEPSDEWSFTLHCLSCLNCWSILFDRRCHWTVHRCCSYYYSYCALKSLRQLRYHYYVFGALHFILLSWSSFDAGRRTH